MKSPVGRPRLALGAALMATAIAGNLVLYSSISETRPVVQVVRDIPAGEQVTVDDVRIIDVGALDPSVRVVDGPALSSVLGAFARTRIVAGSLLVEQSLQPQPLVSEGSVVVALPLPAGEVPVGLRERSVVEIILAPDRQTVEQTMSDIRAGLVPVGIDEEDLLPPTVIVTGIVAALPSDDVSVVGERSVSIEVPHADAHLVVAHTDPRVVLLPPEGSNNG